MSDDEGLEALEELLREIRTELSAGSREGLQDRITALRNILMDEGVFTGRSLSNSPTSSPKGHLVRRKSTMPFHIHRNAPFVEDVTLEARNFVHFHHLCKHGHWHGLVHKPSECPQCVRGCGGGAWSRIKQRDEKGDMLESEKKRLSSLLTQAMFLVIARNKKDNSQFKITNAGYKGAANKITYSFETDQWHKSPVDITIEKDQFAEGAMRKCWMMNETGKIGTSTCVAKKYINAESASVATPWIEVQMQAVSKHYAHKFSQHPKCWDTIDFIEAYLVNASPNDPTMDIYAVERYLKGKYIKYNNNSGYCNTKKTTPQAFSHYTWCKSRGKLMVVDIQGVGDLYTDPQIHTSDGKAFGDGNLGPAGMALFFKTHTCNHICKSLGLKEVEIYKGDWCESHLTQNNDEQGTKTIRELAAKLNAVQLQGHSEISYTELRKYSVMPSSMILSTPPLDDWMDMSDEAADGAATTSDEVCDIQIPPEGVESNVQFGAGTDIGAIHMKIAELHSIGRFSNGLPQLEEAFYHTQFAARYRDLSGLLALARLFSGLDSDWLRDLVDIPEKRDLTIILLGIALEEKKSADAGHALASLLSEGHYIQPDPSLVVTYLQAVSPTNVTKLKFLPPEQSFGWSSYILPEVKRLVLLGDMSMKLKVPDYQTAYDSFSEAAELHMANGNGSASAKMYMRAEEVSAYLDDEDIDEEQS